MAASSGSICHSRSLDGKSQERRGNTIPSVPYESTQVNRDGDRTGFSVVETGTNQVWADAGHDDFIVAGYVSPP